MIINIFSSLCKIFVRDFKKLVLMWSGTWIWMVLFFAHRVQFPGRIKFLSLTSNNVIINVYFENWESDNKEKQISKFWDWFINYINYFLSRKTSNAEYVHTCKCVTCTCFFFSPNAGSRLGENENWNLLSSGVILPALFNTAVGREEKGAGLQLCRV